MMAVRRCWGVVRVWNDPDNIRTEFSVIIRDDLQGLGIGSLLMKKNDRLLHQYRHARNDR